MNKHNPPRKRTTLTLDPKLIEEARALNINISQSAEKGLREDVRIAKTAAWKAENAEAIKSANAYVEENGLPLAEYRMF